MNNNPWQFIQLKPMSVNKSYKGRRFKTDEYLVYEIKVKRRLKNMVLPYSKKYKITLNFGFSNSAADWDNPIKPFQDILQKKYSFNDKLIFKADVEKWIVKKGEEFIEFKIEPYEQKKWIKKNVE